MIFNEGDGLPEPAKLKTSKVIDSGLINQLPTEISKSPLSKVLN